MKIDVIGGSGFIGNKLCEIFEKEEIDYQILDIAINPKYKTKTISFQHINIKSNIKDVESSKDQPIRIWVVFVQESFITIFIII